MITSPFICCVPIFMEAQQEGWIVSLCELYVYSSYFVKELFEAYFTVKYIFFCRQLECFSTGYCDLYRCFTVIKYCEWRIAQLMNQCYEIKNPLLLIYILLYDSVDIDKSIFYVRHFFFVHKSFMFTGFFTYSIQKIALFRLWD